MPVLACYARLKAIHGLYITTVEGLQRDGTLHPLQHSFLEHYSFQCGFSTPGFLMAGYILLDNLRRSPVPRDRLDQVILDVIEGNICRCTGYIRYFTAIRQVILDTPGLVAENGVGPKAIAPTGICFRLLKRSANDLTEKVIVGYFEAPTGEVRFTGTLSLDTGTAWMTALTASIRTGERVRDLNLRRFFFVGSDRIDIVLTRAWPLDKRLRLDTVAPGTPVPLGSRAVVKFGAASMEVETELIVRLLSDNYLRIVSRAPIRFDLRDLEFPVVPFIQEFGLRLGQEVEVTLDVQLPYTII